MFRLAHEQQVAERVFKLHGRSVAPRRAARGMASSFSGCIAVD
jgi:hypothetical protein